MNIPRSGVAAWGGALALTLAASVMLSAQPPTAVSQKQSLVLPVLAAIPNADPARSLDAVISFGPPIPTSALACNGDGTLLASGGYQEVLIWDLLNGVLQKRLGPGQLSDAIGAVAFNRDGRLLAVAEGTPYGSGGVKLFDVESGQIAATVLESHDTTLCLAWSPDGKWLAAAGVDAVVRVWSVDENKLVAEVKGHSDWVRSLCSVRTASCSPVPATTARHACGEVGTWNRSTELRESDPICGVALSPDSQFLVLAVVGANDKVLRLRRRDNGQVARDVNLVTTAPLDVVWNAQNNRVYVPCSDNTARIYDGGNWGQVANCMGHSDWVYRMATVGDASRVATTSADGTVKLWSAADGRLLATLIQLAPRTDEWLIMTSAGYMATSTPAAIQWRSAGLTMPPDQISSLLQNSELVKQALAGAAVAAPAIE